LAPSIQDPINPGALRRAVGLAVPDAAAAIGCDRRSLVRYEQPPGGEHSRTPDAVQLLRMARAYGLGLDRVGALARWWEVTRG
jgi:Helix-turn-helix domain